MADRLFSYKVWYYNCIILTVFSFCSEGTVIDCYCEKDCPPTSVDTDPPQNGSCRATLCYMAKRQIYNTETGLPQEERLYGCLPPEESGYMQCKGYLVQHEVPKNISCCSSGNLCNKYLTVELRLKARPDDGDIFTDYGTEMLGFSDWRHVLAFAISLGVISLLVFILVVYIYCRKLRFRREEKVHPDCKMAEGLLNAGTSLRELIDQSSGSGSGLPLLVQRTIARQIDMLHSIGKGRYGEVWKARWRDEYVAAKIFYTTEEASWQRETEIYQTVLLRHEYILGFVASDIRGTGSWTQLLLITDYHERGSLHDYLRACSEGLSPGAALWLAYTATSGLYHLHTEFDGHRGKPAIAHRDLKSKNILVKKDGSCCLADFGLAIKYSSLTNEMTPSLASDANPRVGTKRYMPPEILDESIDLTKFSSFILGDMYSFALVLWELASRCIVNGKVGEYQIPFQDQVPSDPSFEDMRKIVCGDQQRPRIPEYWKDCELTDMMGKMITACWAKNPQNRLLTLRLKKTFAKLLISCQDSKPLF